MYPGAILVKEGTFLYDDLIPCTIKLFKHDTKYGSGDYEDETEFRDDVSGEFYYIGFGSTVDPEKITSGSSALNSLDEAIKEAEAATQNKIKWN